MTKRIRLDTLKSSFGTLTFTKTAADFPTQLTASQVIPGLSFSVKANEVYDFRYHILHSGTANGVGAKVVVNVPAFKTYSARIELPVTVNSTTIQYVTASTLGHVSAQTPGTNISSLGFINGTLIPSTDGTLSIGFAAETTLSGSDQMVCLAGSNGILTRFNG